MKKWKKAIVFALALAFSFVLTGKEAAVSAESVGIDGETIRMVRRSVSGSAFDNPELVLSVALDSYRNGFSDYLDITALNVQDKEAIEDEHKDTGDIILISSIGKNGMQVDLDDIVDLDLCVANQTHRNGISSYTWSGSTARELVLKAGSGFTTHMPELHLRNKYERDDHSPKYAFMHYHNYDAAGNKITKPAELNRVHSLFGPLYWTENDDGMGDIY